MDEKRLQELENTWMPSTADWKEVITEIRELKAEIKVMDAMLEHYTTALTQLLKEAHTLWARKKQPHSANPINEEEKSDD